MKFLVIVFLSSVLTGCSGNESDRQTRTSDVSLQEANEHSLLRQFLQKQQTRIDNVMAESNGGIFAHVSPKYVDYLKEKSKKLSIDISRLMEEESICRQDSNQCTAPVSKALPIIWPVSIENVKKSRMPHLLELQKEASSFEHVDASNCSVMQTRALEDGCISFDEYRIFFTMNIVPRCSFSRQYGAAEPCE